MIKSFSDWMKENNPGNYVSIGVKSIPLDLVQGMDGIPCTEPHVTLMYSKGSAVPVNHIEPFLNKHEQALTSQPATVKGTNVFADVNKDASKGCIVMELDHPSLHSLHQDISSVGCKHSFSPLQPHATLIYGVPIDQAHAKAKEIEDKVKGMQVNLGGFTNQLVNENWTDTLNKG